MRLGRLIFIFIIFLFSSCGAPSKKTGQQSDVQYPEQYARLGIPEIQLFVHKGDTVLAPQKKFLEAFLEGEKNFFWFQPRLVDSVGEFSVYVWEIDSLLEVPNAFVVAFPEYTEVRKGEYVFTWWQGGSGLQRAYVLDVLDSDNVVVRYLDLDIFTVGDGTSLIDTIRQGTFRVIRDNWDPGASVVLDSGGSQSFYVIINRNAERLVCRSSLGRIEFFGQKDVRPNGVYKDLTVNQSVTVPFYGIYIPGSVVALKDGYAEVRVQIVDHIDTLSVPLLDVFVD